LKWPVRKVPSTISQPSADTDRNAAIARGSAACHTVAGNGCHTANSRINTRLAHNT
jgi:hypothetical protein